MMTDRKPIRLHLDLPSDLTDACLLVAFRAGLDTHQLAQATFWAEAEIYNAIGRARAAEAAARMRFLA